MSPCYHPIPSGIKKKSLTLNTLAVQEVLLIIATFMLPFFASQALCFSNFFFLPFFLLLSPTTQSQQLLKTIQALFIYPEIQNGSLGSQICRHGQAEAPWSRALLPGAPGQDGSGPGGHTASLHRPPNLPLPQPLP